MPSITEVIEKVVEMPNEEDAAKKTSTTHTPAKGANEQPTPTDKVHDAPPVPVPPEMHNDEIEDTEPSIKVSDEKQQWLQDSSKSLADDSMKSDMGEDKKSNEDEEIKKLD